MPPSGTTAVAARIEEVIPAAGLGAPLPPAGALARLRAECGAEGSLWIADEVLTGFGRCGALFAWQRLAERPEDAGVEPDLVVFGKAAGAGFAALAGVLVGARVAAAVETLPESDRFTHHQTYGGNPIACAVGRRVLAALREERLFARVRELEPELDRALAAVAAHPVVSEVRGIGFLRGVELRGAGSTARVEQACRERGMLVYAAAGGGGTEADADGPGFLLLAPPLVADAATLRDIGSTLRAAL
jgi:beta-alanine--pyruvate transaminase